MLKLIYLNFKENKRKHFTVMNTTVSNVSSSEPYYLWQARDDQWLYKNRNSYAKGVHLLETESTLSLSQTNRQADR